MFANVLKQDSVNSAWQAKCGWPPRFVNKVYWNTAIVIHLYISYIYFCTTAAALRSCDKEYGLQA